MNKIKELNCILLIDDDKYTNFIHNKVIKDANVNIPVYQTRSGAEALEFLTSTGRYAGNEGYPQPGIIFLDINMPGMNGWEFMGHYNKLADNQKAIIVVAMLTSSINVHDKMHAEKNEDIRSFLQKPLTREMLFRTIEENFEVEQPLI